MSYFVWGPHGRVEVDYTVTDGTLPTLGGKPHPHPQHWHDIRALAIERDLGRCVTCNSGWRIEVHHRVYVRWGRERLADVYCLCHQCHTVFHAERRLAG